MARTSGPEGSAARRAFSALLDRALARPPAPPVLAGLAPGERRPGDPQEKIAPIPRWMIVLSGEQRVSITRRGVRCDVRLRPGEALHYPRHAWDLHHWALRSRFLAVVYHQRFVRLLVGDYAGAPAAPEAQPALWFHTATAIGDPGRHALSALDACADGGVGDYTVAALFRALLLETRSRLVDDPGPPRGSGRTWALLRELLAERCGEELSRDSVAAAMGLHPGYVSTLCTQQGRPFRRLLEDLRCERAARLMRADPRLPVERLARLCGYATSSAFIRMYRRVTGATPGRGRPR
jgi:AraC-like DNA-binding protein